MIEETVSISRVKQLLDEGYEVEVDSPDGFVPVTQFVDKGIWDEYILYLENGVQVRVNENHLFETPLGWKYAKDLAQLPDQNFLTKNGYVRGRVGKTGARIPIVDITVDSEEHRYYTNGVSSHNTGVGKSMFMCHMAAASVMQNLNVLYITMEMAEERIAERIDANLLNIRLDDLKALPKETYQKKINRLKENVKGRLIIKEYPTASASSIHFRNLLNELNLKKSFRPDIIFIDYLNICASARIKHGANVNSYSYIKAIAEELRGLAVEYDLPIVSATQTTRSGFGNSDPGLEDTSESFGLPATADFMFALVATEELNALNQIMVKQLKNRYNDPNLNKRFVIGVDRARMKFFDATNQTSLNDSGQDHEDNRSYDDKFKDKKSKFKTLRVD